MKLLEATPFKSGDLELDEDQLRNQCLELLEDIYREENRYKTFRQNGAHNETIQVHTFKGSNGWAGRSNTISANDYNLENVVKALTGCAYEGDKWKLADPTLHTYYEKQYMGKLVESFVVLKGAPEPWYCVELNYNLGPLLKTRKFYEYIRVLPPLKQDESSKVKLFGKESGFIVSVPADIEEIQQRLRSNDDSNLHSDSVPTDSKNSRNWVYAQYSSVETIGHSNDSQDLIWNMATSSNAGGFVPNFITALALPRTIAQDVPHLLRWIASEKEITRRG
ncbi:BA75_01808T0 [Komagataella pastoris]|uniref:BA75_01808T0 n=1 Tax=Komagataella pastoris TaxID=4922 RepID=A0A1B2J8J3_PICPA|nr:BA75_01808T0 [Komagataella pastoris]